MTSLPTAVLEPVGAGSRFPLWPSSATLDARWVLCARALRGFADGAVSVLLADYLRRLGFTPLEVGILVTSTMLGSALLTIGVGLSAHRFERRSILLASSALMFCTGLAFTGLRDFWPLVIVAFIGTLNPSSGDVSVFLPTEQAVLAETVRPPQRTAIFAWYNLAGTFAGAFGALASGAPNLLARSMRIDVLAAERMAFVLYAAIGLSVAFFYRRLSRGVEVGVDPKRRPLAQSKRTVLKLAAFFSIDSFGGGFVVQSLLVLWLYQRFQLAPEVAATVFFAASLVGALSQFVSSWLAARIGAIRTMVFTHLPANLLLVMAGIVPSAPAAIALLLLRAALSSMDIPARQAYVMAVVPPEERAAASSVTNVPRSLAAAVPPTLTGLLLAHSSFGWPLVLGGLIKAIYDLLLFAQFRHVAAVDDR
jgi:MFS family permease